MYLFNERVGCVILPKGWQWHNMFSEVVFDVVVVVVCADCAEPWWLSGEPTIAVQKNGDSNK